MTDIFYSPRLTLARAEHHIRDFNGIVDQYVQSKPWIVFVDRDSNPSQDLYKVEFTDTLRQMLPCILFDATNNLRAVLDQAGYASAVAAKSSSLKAVKFPFGLTESNFRNNLAGGCKDLPTEICAIFERSNAYKGGDNTLWALNEIANANKHFALKPLVIGNPSAFFSGESVGEGGLQQIVSPGGFGIGWDPEKSEITLMSVPSGSNFRVDADITFNVAIDGVDVLEGQQAVHVLNAMCQKVQCILLDTEAECRRLGFCQ